MQLPDPITLADAAYYYWDQGPAPIFWQGDGRLLWCINHDKYLRDVFWEFAHRIDRDEIKPALPAWKSDGERDYLNTKIHLKDFFRVARERGDCLPRLGGQLSEPTAAVDAMRTGANPVGRPTGKAVSLATFDKRRQMGSPLEPTLKAEATAILDSWPGGGGRPPRALGTIANHIRDEYRRARMDTGIRNYK